MSPNTEDLTEHAAEPIHVGPPVVWTRVNVTGKKYKSRQVPYNYVSN